MEIESFFGKRDAGQEDADRLAEYFYKLNLLDKMKVGEKTTGACVVVGVKGSGKTAICKMVEIDHFRDDIGWKLGMPDGFSVKVGEKRSSYYRSLLTVHLLSRLMDLVEGNKSKFSKDALKALPSGVDKLRQRAQSVLKNTKISVGTSGVGLDLDVGELLEEGQRALSQLTLADFREALGPCLAEKKGYILVDDVDEIFPNSDLDHEFIEGLMAAAVDINKAFGELLHCLVFLKAGAYSHYFEHGRNYDKYSDEAVVVLRWGPDELTEMLAMRARVAVGAGAVEEEAWKSLKRVFEGNKKDAMQVLSYMLERSNSGPRDLIIFGNLAKWAADDRKIRMEDLVAQESRYSSEKLYLLNRDYQIQYGDVSNLLARVFRSKPATYARGELRLLIQTEMLGNAEIMRGEFGSMPLLRSVDASRIMEKLFDFGFIGFRDSDRSAFTYMMDMHSDLAVPGARLLSAHQHRIHPAYEAYLMLEK